MAYTPQGRGRGEEGQHGGPQPTGMPKPREISLFGPGDGKKALNRELLDGTEELAQQIVSVPPSQIRRFYADVTAFDRRLAFEKDLTDAAVQAQMGLLKAKAAYAHARDRRSFSAPLLQFFIDHAAAVRTREDFAAFRRVFETLIAYHRFYIEKQKGN